MERLRTLIRPTLSAAGILLALLTAGACAGLRPPPLVVDRSNDARILADVEGRLRSEPSIQPTALRVEVNGGVVLLYGSVSGMGAWECAIRNAELVPGVATVVDYLVIQRGPAAATCEAPRDPT